jgi:hypothetical protein
MESKMKIIGISGRARSGKDTLAAILKVLDRNAVQLSFAAPIREFVGSLVGLSVDEITNSDAKERPIPWLDGKSPRHLMQTLGTEWGRDLVDPNLWIKVAAQKVDTLRAQTNAPSMVVFSDVRFDNEADMIRELGGRIIHLVRSASLEVSDHVSENGVTPSASDLHIQNNGSLEAFEIAAGQLLDDYLLAASDMASTRSVIRSAPRLTPRSSVR